MFSWTIKNFQNENSTIKIILLELDKSQYEKLYTKINLH